MLFPLPLLTAAPLGHRPEATAARRRPPSRPDRPGTTPPELRPGIGPAGLPDPFPPHPDRPRGPGSPDLAPPTSTGPSPVSQRGEGEEKGILPITPWPFLYLLKNPSTS